MLVKAKSDNNCFIVYYFNFLSKEDEMGRTCSTDGEKRNAYRILVGKAEGKRPLGRTRRRWVDGMVWIGSIWLRIGISGRLL
jgi:hypothetical protein